MCGLAGFFHARPPVADPARALACLREAIHHRGPDDRGEFLSEDGRIGLASTRLAILDLSAAGHQPMHSADGRYTIAFNGEIYNFQALRAELTAAGAKFRSGSDTEVILQLFARQGTACLGRLRGMFAFALWDAQERTAFLARDPLGIKPLYCYHEPGGGLLAFASELRPLLVSGLVPRRLNVPALADYFQAGTPPEPETLIENVRCLEPGTYLRWHDGEIATEHFWTLPLGGAAAAPASAMEAGEAVRITRAALSDSLERHFVSDVPVGLFLSGGIDSTALLALAQANGHRNLRTFSIGVNHPGFDESDLARRTAKHFGTIHEEWRLDGTTSRALFEQFLQRTDQPSIDGFNTFVVSRLAHEKGMKVVLSGLGGDEIFGGYPIFAGLPRMLALSRSLGWLGPLRTAAGWLLERGATRASWRRLGSFLGGRPTLLAAYSAYRGVYTPREADTLAAGYAEGAPDASRRPQRTAPEPAELGGDLGDAISALEIALYMRNQLLRDSDVMSMANSLELRVPFVDSRFVETMAGVPAVWRLQPGKRLLLQAVPEVPAWIALQPKRGFRFPFEDWLAADWKESLRGKHARRAVPARTWYQKWAVFLFEHWWEQLA